MSNKLIRIFFSNNLNKFVIISSRHSYINIIIPRNNSLMSHCAKQRSSKNIVHQIIFLTNGMEPF